MFEEEAKKPFRKSRGRKEERDRAVFISQEDNEDKSGAPASFEPALDPETKTSQVVIGEESKPVIEKPEPAVSTAKARVEKGERTAVDKQIASMKRELKKIEVSSKLFDGKSTPKKIAEREKLIRELEVGIAEAEQAKARLEAAEKEKTAAKQALAGESKKLAGEITTEEELKVALENETDNEKPKPNRFVTSHGSVYDYLSDGRVQRFKKVTGETIEPMDVTVFVPQFEHLKLEAQFNNVDAESFCGIKNQSQYDRLLVFLRRARIVDMATGEELMHNNGIEKTFNVFLSLVDVDDEHDSNPKTFHIPVSKEPKLGYIPFETSVHKDKGGKMQRSVHIGHEVVEMQYSSGEKKGGQELFLKEKIGKEKYEALDNFVISAWEKFITELPKNIPKRIWVKVWEEEALPHIKKKVLGFLHKHTSLDPIGDRYMDEVICDYLIQKIVDKK